MPDENSRVGRAERNCRVDVLVFEHLERGPADDAGEARCVDERDAATARQRPRSCGKMATSASASNSDGNANSTSIVRMMTLSVTSP